MAARWQDGNRRDPAGGGEDSDLDRLLSEAIGAAEPNLGTRIESDPTAHLELVGRTERAHRRLGEMLQAAVLSARSAGHSWETIGRTLGMSRQAAQQRFGRSGTTPAGGTTGGAESRIVTGLTAFNEMAALNLAGRYGWHSVGYGALYHLLERDDRMWEHRRVLAWGRLRRQLEEDGWQMIGNDWFPWAYYRRPLATPALEGDVSDKDLLMGVAI